MALLLPMFCSTPGPTPHPASMLMGLAHFLPFSSTPLTWEIKVRSHPAELWGQREDLGKLSKPLCFWGRQSPSGQWI